MKLAGLIDGGAVSLSLASALKKSERCKSFGLCGECVILAFPVNILNQKQMGAASDRRNELTQRALFCNLQIVYS